MQELLEAQLKPNFGKQSTWSSVHLKAAFVPSVLDSSGWVPAQFQNTLASGADRKQYDSEDVFILSQGRVKPLVQVSFGVLWADPPLWTLTQGRSDHMLKLMPLSCNSGVLEGRLQALGESLLS